MKHDLMLCAMSAAAGGAAMYFRARPLAALKVLFGRAEAVAADDAEKLKAMAESAAAKLLAKKAAETIAATAQTSTPAAQQTTGA